MTACNDEIEIPKVERCIVAVNTHENHANTYYCICQHPDEEQARVEKLEYCNNYIAVSPESYSILEDFYDSIAQELLECRSL